jgi:hypothetical protein
MAAFIPKGTQSLKGISLNSFRIEIGLGGCIFDVLNGQIEGI